MAASDSEAFKVIPRELSSLKQEVFQRVNDLESKMQKSGNSTPLPDHRDMEGTFRPRPKEFPRYNGPQILLSKDSRPLNFSFAIKFLSGTKFL